MVFFSEIKFFTPHKSDSLDSTFVVLAIVGAEREAARWTAK